MTNLDLTRRGVMLGSVALAACAPTPSTPPADPPLPDDPRFAAIETRIGGRIGVAALNTADGAWLTHRAQERFAMCSTFKWVLAAAVLHSVQSGVGLTLDQQVRYSQADILPNSPRTQANLSRGWMSVEEMCEAIMLVSDNTAANALLVGVNGPEGLTHFLNANGDGVSRLDRTETALNENLRGDPRDTTTPDASVRTLERFLTTDAVLNTASREKLIGWMIACQTGLTRLRAGLPPSWRVGDKTGTSDGGHNATNDVAIAWPDQNRAPIIIASYLSDSSVDMAARNAAHADIARIVAETWG
jgi:beta-lactamase class A